MVTPPKIRSAPDRNKAALRRFGGAPLPLGPGRNGRAATFLLGLILAIAARGATAEDPAPATERLPPPESAADVAGPRPFTSPEEIRGAPYEPSPDDELFIARGQSGFNRALNQTINHQQRETPGGPVPSGTDLIMTAPSTAPAGLRMRRAEQRRRVRRS